MNDFEKNKCKEMNKACKPTKSTEACKLIRTVITEEIQGITSVEIGDLTLKTTDEFINVFKNLPDDRKQCRIKYDIASLTVLIFFSVLAGYYNCVEISFYIEKQKKLFKRMGLIIDDSPSHDCIRTILKLYKPEVLCKAFRVVFRDFLRYFAETGEIICVDGKYMNGTDRNGNTTNCGSVNFYDADNKIPFVQYPIKEKESEMKLVQTVLSDLNIKKKIICADALHTQKETTKLIEEGGGYYLLPLKENQQCSYDNVKLYFDDLLTTEKKRSRYFFTYTKRNILKQIYIVPESKLPELKERFTGIKYFVLFRKTNLKTNETEDLYLITSINRKIKIVNAIKSRWSAENDLHRHKDMLFDEDKYQTSDSSTASTVAIFNSFALSFVRMVQPAIKAPSLRIARKYLQTNLIECITDTITHYGINRIAIAITEIKPNKR